MIFKIKKNVFKRMVFRGLESNWCYGNRTFEGYRKNIFKEKVDLM